MVVVVVVVVVIVVVGGAVLILQSKAKNKVGFQIPALCVTPECITKLWLVMILDMLPLQMCSKVYSYYHSFRCSCAIEEQHRKSGS